jgi:pimeloyl-ACP methyl ester carboxylesterase
MLGARKIVRILEQTGLGFSLIVWLGAALSGCGGGGGGGGVQIPVVPARGAIAFMVHTFSVNQAFMEGVLQEGMLSQDYTAQQTVGLGEPSAIALKGLSAASGVDFYDIFYYSTSPAGGLTLLSGVLVVPQHPGVPVPLLAYEHATQIKRSDAPSQNFTDSETLAVAAAFASNGYAVAIADYLGLGSSNLIQPFLIDSLTVPGCIDMIKAAQSALASLHIATNGQLFVSGYSQGGHNAMAVAHEIQEHADYGLSVTAAAALSGPYNLVSPDFFGIAEMPDVSHSATVSMAFIIFANNTYEMAPASLSDAFEAPWPPQIPALFNGTQDQGEIFNTFFNCTNCAPPPGEVINLSFLQTVLNDPTNPLAIALNQDQQWNWTPHAPTEIGWSSSDDLIPPTQSQQAFGFMSNSGAPVTAITFSGFTHDQAFVPATVSARRFLDQFRK